MPVVVWRSSSALSFFSTELASTRSVPEIEVFICKGGKWLEVKKKTTPRANRT